jgi:hypothetical protein
VDPKADAGQRRPQDAADHRIVIDDDGALDRRRFGLVGRVTAGKRNV